MKHNKNNKYQTFFHNYFLYIYIQQTTTGFFKKFHNLSKVYNQYIGMQYFYVSNKARYILHVFFLKKKKYQFEKTLF